MYSNNVVTCVVSAFAQFDALRKRNAFVDNYRQFRMFRDGFEEFDHAKEVVQSLIEEYQAAEKADYLSWGSPSAGGGGGGAGAGAGASSASAAASSYETDARAPPRARGSDFDEKE